MVQESIKSALLSVQEGIRDSESAKVVDGLKSLDALLAEHRGELDPQLVHFLSRRSYEKALMFLEGEGDIPKGVCGGR